MLRSLGLTYLVYYREAADADGSLSDDIRSAVYELDTCYSWVVLLACSVVVLISQIPITISGILYLEFIESFPNHKNLILWGCSLAASLTYLLGESSQQGSESYSETNKGKR